MNPCTRPTKPGLASRCALGCLQAAFWLLALVIAVLGVLFASVYLGGPATACCGVLFAILLVGSLLLIVRDVIWPEEG